MTIDKIERIIYAEVEGFNGSYPKNVTPAAKEIYKLHLEDKLEMCITLALQSNKGLQTQANIIDKIIAIGKELQQELKTLEGE